MCSRIVDAQTSELEEIKTSISRIIPIKIQALVTRYPIAQTLKVNNIKLRALKALVFMEPTVTKTVAHHRRKIGELLVC